MSAEAGRRTVEIFEWKLMAMIMLLMSGYLMVQSTPGEASAADDARSLNRRALEKLSAPRAPLQRRKPPVLLSGGMEERDYPTPALQNELTGRVLVSYIISVQGRARDCRVEQSSGHVILDDKTCKIVNSRYLLRPALNEQGRPYEMRAQQYVSWRIPE